MEKVLNIVLYLLFAAAAAFFGWQHYEENYQAKPFKQPDAHAAPLFKVEERLADNDDPWFDEHFTFPIPVQGEPPEGWTEAETSLDPEACGVCHPQQLADWKTSWHADAMGIGAWGTIIDLPDEKVVRCQRCHAPMTEQLPRLKDGSENPAFMADQQLKAITCVACHVREHERMGPPKDGEPFAEAPHGGFTPAEQFNDSKFCASCHDFPQGWKSLNDKLFQETYAEWRHTDYAAEDSEDPQTCQSCHMPEGRHLWRGIHDLETVQSAFEATAAVTTHGATFEPVRADFVVTNVGAGHRFPTYTTPEVVLFIEQVDAAGEPIEGTRQRGTIARRLKSNLSEEYFDTRLLPGESFEMAYSAARHEDAVALTARVEIWPDEAYRRLHKIRVGNPEKHPEGLAMLQEALQASEDSRYVAWEKRLELNAE